MKNGNKKLISSIMLGTMLTAALALGMPTASHAAAPQAAAQPQEIVNINTATVEQLVSLPGIGPAKAQAIVDYRSKTPFRTIADLTQVKGIGEKLLAKIQPYVTVSGSAAPMKSAANTN